MSGSTESDRLNQLGNELADKGQSVDAEQAYLAAAKADPSWSAPLYNLGLLYKYQGRWNDSLRCNQRAVELSPDDRDAWWNLGIAATAVGNWTEARRAWASCGIKMPAGDGPPECNFGVTPVRLDPEGDGEVVWAQRIDPARARLLSVPLPTSSYHWGDIVLHDGAAEGYRVVDEVEYPVFNVLTRLIASPFSTFIVELGTASPPAIERLEVIASDFGGAAEDWGTSTNILCRDCSLGRPHEHSDSSGIPAHPHLGLAARNFDHAKKIIESWLSSTPGADIVTWNAAPESAA